MSKTDKVPALIELTVLCVAGGSAHLIPEPQIKELQWNVNKRKVHGAKRVPFFQIRSGESDPVSRVRRGVLEERQGVQLGVNSTEREKHSRQRKSKAVQRPCGEANMKQAGLKEKQCVWCTEGEA